MALSINFPGPLGSSLIDLALEALLSSSSMLLWASFSSSLLELINSYGKLEMLAFGLLRKVGFALSVAFKSS